MMSSNLTSVRFWLVSYPDRAENRARARNSRLRVVRTDPMPNSDSAGNFGSSRVGSGQNGYLWVELQGFIKNSVPVRYGDYRTVLPVLYKNIRVRNSNQKYRFRPGPTLYRPKFSAESEFGIGSICTTRNLELRARARFSVRSG